MIGLFGGSRATQRTLEAENMQLRAQIQEQGQGQGQAYSGMNEVDTKLGKLMASADNSIFDIKANQRKVTRVLERHTSALQQNIRDLTVIGRNMQSATIPQMRMIHEQYMATAVMKCIETHKLINLTTARQRNLSRALIRATDRQMKLETYRDTASINRTMDTSEETTKWLQENIAGDIRLRNTVDRQMDAVGNAIDGYTETMSDSLDIESPEEMKAIANQFITLAGLSGVVADNFVDDILRNHEVRPMTGQWQMLDGPGLSQTQETFRAIQQQQQQRTEKYPLMQTQGSASPIPGFTGNTALNPIQQTDALSFYESMYS